MENKKKVLLVCSTSFALGLGAILPMAANSKPLAVVFGTDECVSGEHVGYHYAAKDPTCTEPGNLEFWACCDCHHQYLTNPGGTFIDRPVDEAVGGIGPDHIAYVAPTGAHTYENTVIIEDGQANIYYACTQCGDKQSAVLNTMVAKRAAKVTPRFELANPFVDNGDGSFTSMAIGHSSGSYMELVVDESGILTISYDVSSENNWDWLDVNIVGDSNKIIHASGSKTDSVTFEVTAGQVVKITYSKDSGGSSGRDNAIITLGAAEFVYNALTFNSKGGTEFAPSFIENGKLVGDLPVPTKADAYFEGWYLEEALTTPVTVDTVYAGNATIYAKYSEPLTITYHSNGGTVFGNQSFQTGTEPEVTNVPTRDGFTFLGWYEDELFNTPYAGGARTASFDLYAKWFDNTNRHELYGFWGGFKASGTSSPSASYATMSVTVEGSYAVQNTWNTYLEGTFDSISGTGVVTVATSNDGNAIVDLDRDVVVFFPGGKTPNETGFGFYVLIKDASASLTGVTSKFVKVSSSNDTRLYSFNAGSETVTILVDTPANAFYYDVTVEDVAGNALAVSSIGNSTAGFTVKDSSGAVIADYAADDPGVFVKTVDAYRGVYTGADGDIVVGGKDKVYWSVCTTNSLADYTEMETNKLYVYYSATIRYVVTLDPVGHTYTAVVRTVPVTLDLNYEGAEALPVSDVKYDYWASMSEVAGANVNPTRAGYAFDGWYTEAVGGTKISGNKKYTEATTVYAHWLKAITVNFAETDDTAVAGVSPIEAVEGSAVGTLPVPTKANFEFDGWYEDKAFNTPFTASSVAGTSDITVYAKWIATITVSFHSNVPGDVTTHDVSTLPNRAIIAPSFAYAGHYIEGYYADAGFSTPVTLTNGVAADGDIYVKWAEGAAATGSYKGFNLYNTGSQNKTSSSLSSLLSVAADGSVTGQKTATITSGVNGSVTGTGNYFYYNEAGILWTAYGSKTDTVGTDTYIFFRDTDLISSIDFMKLGSVVSGSDYTFIGKINHIDGSSMLIAGFNNAIYDNVTIEGKAFSEISTSSTGYTVKDKTGNVIFSK